MISSAELAALQTDANAALDQSCTIQRPTRVADGLGSYTETLATVATVSAIVNKPSANLMQQYAAKLGDVEIWQVLMPASTDVRENDVLTVGGQTLRVQVPFVPVSYEVLRMCLAAEVR